MKRLLAILAAATLASGSARAAIGTPVALGNISTSTASTSPLSITTTADNPAGNLTLVAIATGNYSVSVSDGVNTYTACPTRYLDVVMYYAINAGDLPSGSAITVTPAGSTKLNISAITVSGVRATSACDIAGAGATSTGTAVSSPASGTLNAMPEIVIGLVAVLSGGIDAITQPGGWIGLTKAGVSGGNAIQWAYQIVSSKASLTYSPTLGTTRTWYANIASFVDASVPAPSVTGTRMSLTGVGH